MSDKIKIMIVDDDETIIDTLSFNLKRGGFEVVPFNSGLVAISKFTEVLPDLVMLDWMMPDMKGPDLCGLIREQSADVPIIMLTGRSTPSDVAFGLASGADDYLVKPFSMVELMARIDALCAVLSKTKRKRSKTVLSLVRYFSTMTPGVSHIMVAILSFHRANLNFSKCSCKTWVKQ
ncbi:MAG: response regulator [Candidatus Obscuribacter sp.]|nr:response regulator [Candidatus Obscuribacter sp.]